MTPAALQTADDLLRFREPGKTAELVRGVLVVREPPGTHHGRCSNRLAHRVTQFVERRDMGEVFAQDTGFKIGRDPDTVRAPDVAFVARDRVSQIPTAGYAELAPDWVAEILSPGDRPGEVLERIGQWLDAGVRLVWLLDPLRRDARIYRADGTIMLVGPDEELDGEDVFTGLRVRSAQLARKVFDPKPEVLEAATIDKLKKRFQREVRIQSQLSRDYFIPVLDADLDGDPPWFTMPLADCNYETKIDDDRKARRVDSAALADILAALEELHSLGYAHRDLKPTNILYHDGRWKLSDFGLVLPMSDHTTTTITSINSGWGSHRYCSPEQAVAFHDVTVATDIYAFGCILHDLVAELGELRYPYQQATCSGPFAAIIEKCTEVSPKKRFKSVGALRGVLMMMLAKKLPAPSEKAAEWVHNLEGAEEWDVAKVKDLVRLLRWLEDDDDRLNIMSALDEEKLEVLHGKDPDVWDELARLYCEWISGRGFGFEYCDVLIRRLEKVFELGSIGVKATTALAAADLGRSHNRWFVMGRLMAMCGPTLEAKTAERIAIEIMAEEVQDDFVRCAEVIYREAQDYHPTIAAVLVKPEARTAK